MGDEARAKASDIVERKAQMRERKPGRRMGLTGSREEGPQPPRGPLPFPPTTSPQHHQSTCSQAVARWWQPVW